MSRSTTSNSSGKRHYSTMAGKDAGLGLFFFNFLLNSSNLSLNYKTLLLIIIEQFLIGVSSFIFSLHFVTLDPHSQRVQSETRMACGGHVY
jgi:hypothetical protein